MCDKCTSLKPNSGIGYPITLDNTPPIIPDTGKAFLHYNSKTLLDHIRSHDWVERALFVIDTLLIDTVEGDCLDFSSLKEFRDYAGY